MRNLSRLMVIGWSLTAVMMLGINPIRGDQPLSLAEVDRLIKQLGSDKFADREDASQKLQQAGVDVFVPLRRAATQHPDAEIRARTARIVEALTEKFFGEVRVFEDHGAQVNNLAVSATGQQMLSGSLDGVLRLWDVASGQQMRSWDNQPGAIWAVALANDGSLGLSVAGMSMKDGQWVPGKDFGIRVWDIESGKELRRLEGHASEVRSLTLSPDQKRVLSASWDKTARLWDLAAGKELRRLEGHTDRVRQAAFSPDGKRAVTVSKDGTARVWDLNDGKELARFTGHADDVLCAVFTPDGKRVLSSGADKMLRLWDAASGKELKKLAGHTTVVWSVAVSPDGRWAISGGGHVKKSEGFFQPAGEDNAVRLWDLGMGAEVTSFKGHGSALMTVRFANDGHRAFSASSDATVRLWKVFEKDN